MNGALLVAGTGSDAGTQLDVLGDLVAAHLDTAALSQLISEGPPAGLPVIHPAGVVV